MPYTTEQIQSVSNMVRLNGVSVEAALETLKAFEQVNGDEDVYVDERTGEVLDDPFTVCYGVVPRHAGYYRTYGGRLVKRYEYVGGDEHHYADEVSARLDGWHTCDRCGEWSNEDDPDHVEIDGNWYCSSDCATDDGYHTCDSCGEWYHEDDEVWCGDYGYCSESCAENDGWHRCERCGCWVHDDDAYTVWHGCDKETWCESCYNDYGACCDRCGEMHHVDEMHADGNGYWYCDDCYDEDDCDSIPTWDIYPRIKLFSVPGFVPGPHVGVELETDGDSRYEYASELDAIEGFDELFWMGGDGSLSDDGVELKSQPMTLAKHESIRCIYDRIGEIAKRYGYTSHDNGRCGIHISVNRDWFGKSEIVQDAHIYKLMRLLQRFECQFTTFSRRQDNHWCNYGTHRSYAPTKDKVDLKTTRRENDELLEKSRTFKENERDKYQAVNIRHSSHVEIRIFRGTLRWSTYFASLALVDGLSRLVKLHGSRWIEDVSWYELVDEVVAQVRAGGNEFSAKCLEDYLEEKSLR